MEEIAHSRIMHVELSVSEVQTAEHLSGDRTFVCRSSRQVADIRSRGEGLETREEHIRNMLTAVSNFEQKECD